MGGTISTADFTLLCTRYRSASKPFLPLPPNYKKTNGACLYIRPDGETVYMAETNPCSMQPLKPEKVLAILTDIDKAEGDSLTWAGEQELKRLLALNQRVSVKHNDQVFIGTVISYNKNTFKLFGMCQPINNEICIEFCIDDICEAKNCSRCKFRFYCWTT